MGRILIVMAAVGAAGLLAACHPVSADSTAGKPVPPADAPSDGASGAAGDAGGAISDNSAD